jgi:hypothetical protein
MLLAKLALGCGGTLVLAGAYTFHEGVMRVDEDQADGRHVHVWVPAAMVPLVMHAVPKHYLEPASRQAAPWLPTFRAVTRELKKYPGAELLEVDDATGHVRVRTRGGKLLIDVDEPGNQVHVACPLAMMEDVASELERDAPGV